MMIVCSFKRPALFHHQINTEQMSSLQRYKSDVILGSTSTRPNKSATILWSGASTILNDLIGGNRGGNCPRPPQSIQRLTVKTICKEANIARSVDESEEKKMYYEDVKKSLGDGLHQLTVH